MLQRVGLMESALVDLQAALIKEVEGAREVRQGKAWGIIIQLPPAM